MRLLYALALSLSLMGCSFGKDSSGNGNKRELEEQAKAEADYNLVVGTYAGKLLGSTKYDIELKLFTLQIPTNETNADGRTKFRTELRANYKKINPVAPGYTFQAQFYPETGRVVLTNMEKEENLGMDDIHTIEVTLVRKTMNGVYIRQLRGEAKGSRGPLGKFENLNLVTEQSDKPEQNEEDEYNERLRKQFQEIEGNYEGVVKQDPRVGPPVAVTLRLYISNDGGNSKRPPLLKGLFSPDDGGDIQFDLQTVYKPELNPPKLTMKGTVLRAPNSNLTLLVDGHFETIKVGNEMKKAFVGHAQYSSLTLDGRFVLIQQ